MASGTEARMYASVSAHSRNAIKCTTISTQSEYMRMR